MQTIFRWLAAHGSTVGRGVLMGGADIVPGVSGGTVALIVGIYQRLVTAVSHFDLKMLGLLRKGQWNAAAKHVDLPLLLPLGMGILVGFICMTVLMHFLLSTEETRTLTMAVFFGLIFASGVLVALMIYPRGRRDWISCLLLGMLGAGFAWWVAGLQTSAGGDPHLGFVFFSGAVAICAMILPGISGAMILLVLGVYIHLTEIPGNLLRGEHLGSGLGTMAVFAVGCAVGLITFSKILYWLLKHHHAATMALLCGFMFGSLRKLWPFQRDLTPEIEKVKLKTFEPVMPGQLDGQVLSVAVVFLVACLFVWAIDWFTDAHLRRLLVGRSQRVSR